MVAVAGRGYLKIIVCNCKIWIGFATHVKNNLVLGNKNQTNNSTIQQPPITNRQPPNGFQVLDSGVWSPTRCQVTTRENHFASEVGRISQQEPAIRWSEGFWDELFCWAFCSALRKIFQQMLFFSMRLWSEISVVVFCFCLWIWVSFTRPCVRTAHVARSIDQVCFSRLGTSTRGGYRGLRQEGPLPRRSQSVKFQLPVGTSAPPIALYFQETSKFSPCRSTCHRTWTQGPNWDLAPISATELAAQWWSWATQMVMLSVQAFQLVVDIKHFLERSLLVSNWNSSHRSKCPLILRHIRRLVMLNLANNEVVAGWQILWTSKDYGKTTHWHHIHILPNVQSQTSTSSLWAVRSMKCESSVKLRGGRCRSFRGLCSHEETWEEWKNWKIQWHREQNKAVLPGKFDVEM